MRTTPFFRPTWRAVTLTIAAVSIGVAGAATGVELLVWFGFALGCLVTIVGVWVAIQLMGDRRRGVQRSLKPAQLQVGRPTVTAVGFSKPGDAPVLSHLVDSIPRAVAGAGSSTERVIHPAARGLLTLGPVLLHRRDPFGLFYWRTRARGRDAEVVWPRTDAVDPELFQRLRTLTVGAAGPPTPEIDDLSLREYRHGDPLSRINWKRTAAHGTLLVRHDEPGRNTDIDLVLVAGAPEATDRAVEVLAAAATELSSPEMSLRLLLPGEESTGGLGSLLTKLALAKAGTQALPSTPPKGVVIVASAASSVDLARELTSWVAASEVEPESVFIFPCVGSDAETLELLRMFTVIHT